MVSRDPYRRPGAKLAPVQIDPKPAAPVFPEDYRCTMCDTQSLQWLDARDGTRRLMCTQCDQVLATNAPPDDDEE